LKFLSEKNQQGELLFNFNEMNRHWIKLSEEDKPARFNSFLNLIPNSHVEIKRSFVTQLTLNDNKLVNTAVKSADGCIITGVSPFSNTKKFSRCARLIFRALRAQVSTGPNYVDPPLALCHCREACAPQIWGWGIQLQNMQVIWLVLCSLCIIKV